MCKVRECSSTHNVIPAYAVVSGAWILIFPVSTYGSTIVCMCVGIQSLMVVPHCHSRAQSCMAQTVVGLIHWHCVRRHIAPAVSLLICQWWSQHSTMQKAAVLCVMWQSTNRLLPQVMIMYMACSIRHSLTFSIPRDEAVVTRCQRWLLHHPLLQLQEFMWVCFLLTPMVSLEAAL